MKVETEIGTRIKALRLHFELDINQFAMHCELSPTAVYYWEMGRTKKPSKNVLLKIIETFGTTMEWLIKGMGDMLPSGLGSIFQEKLNENIESELLNNSFRQVDFLATELNKLWNIIFVSLEIKDMKPFELHINWRDEKELPSDFIEATVDNRFKSIKPKDNSNSLRLNNKQILFLEREISNLWIIMERLSSTKLKVVKA